MAIGGTILKNQTIESGESVATDSLEWASDTGGTVLNAGSGERFEDVNIQISITFNASATDGAEIHARKSADEGTTEDTEELKTYVTTVDAPGSATAQIVTIPFHKFEYLDIGIKNLDSTYTLTWSAIWEGLKTTGWATS